MYKKRKPRGTKLSGYKSQNMCTGCIAFQCDPMMMSYRFSRKVDARLRKGLCPACGAEKIVKYEILQCKCKSKL